MAIPSLQIVILYLFTALRYTAETRRTRRKFGRRGRGAECCALCALCVPAVNYCCFAMVTAGSDVVSPG